MDERRRNNCSTELNQENQVQDIENKSGKNRLSEKRWKNMAELTKYGISGIILAVGMILSCGIAGAASINEAESSSIPTFPCEYSGSVTIGDLPAPAGTIIRAFIGDEEAGRITVTNTGIYGGTGLFDDRLLVEGNGDVASQEITFKIWSNDVSETLVYQPGDSRTFDLHIAELEGDFNTNAFVDIGDVSKVAYMVADKIDPEISADFNGNGVVDIGDASKIAYFLVRNVEFL
jgi:hypothetical protein